MPELHAKLSPSSADRWMTCPGSVPLSAPFKETTSEYAAEGTLAHAVAEALLNGTTPPEHPAGMDEPVNAYVQHVKELCKPNTVLHVEKRVVVNEDLWGTADAIVWDPATETLYVRDLKYGAGVPVEVSDNRQLKCYALAVMLTMKYPAKTVNVGIVQPRINHPDGHARSKDYDSVDLLEFWADVNQAIADVNSASIATTEGRKRPTWASTYLVPTVKGCRWCLAAPICPRVKDLANTMAQKVFAPELPYDPAELAKVLDSLDVLEGWIENVRKFAYGEAEKGHDIPNYKLVEKRPTRKWKADVAGALAKVLGLDPADLLNPAPMKSVSEIEKLCPGKNAKERAQVLEPYVTKESSGHSLVHCTDTRPAVRLDAVSVFSEA